MSSGISLYVSIAGRDAVPFQFDADAISVGRSEQVDLRIDRPMVSRHQFSVERDADGRYYLVPESTTNPTRLNGTAIRDAAQLADGDVIVVGDVQIHVGLEGAPLDADEAPHYDALDQLRQQKSSPALERYQPVLQAPEPDEPPPPPPAAAPAAAKSKRSLVLAVGAGIFCVGMLAFGLTGGGEDEDDLASTGKGGQQGVEIIRPQPAPDCPDKAECLERAKRTYKLATDLEARADSDPGDLYRAAVAYERADALLKAAGAPADTLPNLQRRRKVARERLEQELKEARFRFSSARKYHDKKRALQELDFMLRLIADEEHPYRKRILASQRRIRSEK